MKTTLAATMALLMQLGTAVELAEYQPATIELAEHEDLDELLFDQNCDELLFDLNWDELPDDWNELPNADCDQELDPWLKPVGPVNPPSPPTPSASRQYTYFAEKKSWTDAEAHC